MNKDFKKRLGFLIFAIILDAAANSVMINSHLGSAVWTASAVNIAQVLHISNGSTLFIYAIIIAILNQVLIGHFDRHIFISNLLFSLPFSYLVDFFVWVLNPLQLNALPLPIRVIVNFIGLAGIAIGISIYQRCNLIQHPNDELAYLLRFKYLKGSAGWSQIISYLPPIAIMAFCLIWTGHLEAIGIGTFFAMFIQGIMIGLSDRFIVPSLKHHYTL